MVGTLVLVRGDQWRVLEVVRHDGCQAWSIEGVRPSNRGDRRTLIVPFDRPRPFTAASSPCGVRRVGRRWGMAALRGLLAGSVRVNQLRGAAAASIDILDYQLEPALACVAGATRLLIADEVGLGKTVEAALVLAELAARGEAGRVLVLTPASLCEQWAAELSQRFRFEPVIVDRAALHHLASWSSLDEGPWARVPLAIASLDFVKQPEVLRGIGNLRWDLLILDEAHTCTQASYRAAAVDWLARRSRRLLMLTATPHGGDEEAFRALCDIGRFPGEPPIVMFRRTRAGLGAPPTRRVRVLRVSPSEAEARMHQALLAYARRVWRWRGGGGHRDSDSARLAMVVLCKRAASGATALLSSLSRRHDLLAPSGAKDAAQLLLPLDESLDHQDEEPARLLGAPGLADEAEERGLVRQLIALAEAAARAETKPPLLLRLLSRARQPAIVFTEYRDTLQHLASRLAPVGPVATLHGGLDRAERREAIARFTTGSARVLLATDAAAHGLNLHHSCRLVVNLELPWSPVRLEQRIGRVDRIGQRRMVHAVHLAARGTLEDRVLARLALKVEAVRRAVGLGASPLGTVGEAEVGAEVFEERALSRDAFAAGSASAPKDTRPGGDVVARVDLRWDAEAEARRLALVRSLAAPRPPGGPTPAAVLAASVRRTPCRFTMRGGRAPLPPGTYALYRVGIVDGRGALLEDDVIVLHLPERPRSTSPGDWNALWQAVRPALAHAVRGEAEQRLCSVRAWLQPAVAGLAAREALIAGLDAVEPQPVQPGLFDRRALKAAAEVSARRHASAQEAAARARDLADASRPVLASPPELTLVLLVSSGAAYSGGAALQGRQADRDP